MLKEVSPHLEVKAGAWFPTVALLYAEVMERDTESFCPPCTALFCASADDLPFSRLRRCRGRRTMTGGVPGEYHEEQACGVQRVPRLEVWAAGVLGSHGAGWKPRLSRTVAPLSSRIPQSFILRLGSGGGSGQSSKLFQMENDEIVLES